MSRMKRKRLGNDGFAGRTLEHYFRNSSSSSTIAVAEADSFEADLERAIEESLNESTDASHNSTSDVVAESSTIARRIYGVDLPDDSPKHCPVCSLALSLTADANHHINKCLDDSEDQQGGEKPPVTGIRSMDGISSGCQDTENTPATSLANERNKEGDDPKSKAATGGKPQKTCPFYKWIQGTPFVVDAFSFGKVDKCEGYFLSHFHSDHYTRLTSSWSHGSIYCSKVTANYVKQQLGVDSKYIIPLPMNQEYALNSSVNVSLIDANHCPGSVLFLFKIFRPDGSIIRHLHTGDFRANPRMCLHPLIRQPENDMIDTLYLDTTYLSGQYSFPGQEEVISATCDLAETCCASREPNESKPSALHSWLRKSLGGQSSQQDEHVANLARSGGESSDVLFVVGTYSIGKEKIFCGLAKRLKSRVYAPASKRALLAQQENKELDSLLTDDPLNAQVHVVPLGQIQEERLSLYLKSFQSRFSSVVAFRPTGWTFSRKTSLGVIAGLSNAPLAQITASPSDRAVVLKPQKTTISTVRIYGVPYSEHSSFRELASFVSSLRIRRIVPTVNVGSQSSREKQLAILDRWQKEKKEKEIRIVSYPSEAHW